MPTATDDLGSIFADAGAFTDPDGWHAAAQRIRAETPILRVTEPGIPTSGRSPSTPT